jgi:hypothetical protein
VYTSPLQRFVCEGFAATYARGFKPLNTSQAEGVLDEWVADHKLRLEVVPTTHIQGGWDIMRVGRGSKLVRVKLDIYQQLLAHMEAHGHVLQPVMPEQRGMRDYLILYCVLHCIP